MRKTWSAVTLTVTGLLAMGLVVGALALTTDMSPVRAMGFMDSGAWMMGNHDATMHGQDTHHHASGNECAGTVDTSMRNGTVSSTNECNMAGDHRHMMHAGMVHGAHQHLMNADECPIHGQSNNGEEDVN